MKVAIGLDLGTTTICGIALDCDSGTVLQSVTLGNDAALPPKNQYERAQDPERIVSLASQILKKLTQCFGLPECIGISGQMHGIVYLNPLGEAVSPLYIWQDLQSSQMMEGFRMSYSAALSHQTGYPVSDGYGLATHYFFSQTGQLPKDACRFCTIGDYLAMRLCAGSRPLIHPTNGASLGVFSLQENAFDSGALQQAGIDPDFLPEVSPDFSLYGSTIEGIPVAVALGDNQASFLGSVREEENTVLVNVGTGSQISLTGCKIFAQGSVESRPFFHGRYLLAGASLCGGRAYAALISFFRQIAALAGRESWDDVYEVIGQRLKSVSCKEPSLRFSTLLCGSRSCPEERGSITGLSLDNFTPEEFARATLEGIADELHEMYLQISEENELSNIPAQLVGSGNGIRKNPVLQQIFQQTFGAPLKIPVHQEEACFGAALYASVCAGIFPDLPSAQKLIRYQDAIEF